MLLWIFNTILGPFDTTLIFDLTNYYKQSAKCPFFFYVGNLAL